MKTARKTAWWLDGNSDLQCEASPLHLHVFRSAEWSITLHTNDASGIGVTLLATGKAPTLVRAMSDCTKQLARIRKGNR